MAKPEQFKIQLVTELIENNHAMELDVFDEELHHSPIDVAIFNFTNKYHYSKWQISVGEKHHKLSLRDLSLIWWNDLPKGLSDLYVSGKGVIGFVEQGVWQIIYMEMISDDLVKIQVTDVLKKPNVDLISSTVVAKKQMMDEWLRFVNEIITYIVWDDLISADDECIQQFLDRFPKNSL